MANKIYANEYPQNAFAKSRQVFTAEHIAAFNQLHSIATRIYEDSQIVHCGNEVK